jgi:hypothetical protein
VYKIEEAGSCICSIGPQFTLLGYGRTGVLRTSNRHGGDVHARLSTVDG